MPSVDNVTSLFSQLSCLFLANYLSKQEAQFPLNAQVRRVIDGAAEHYESFVVRMKAYCGIDEPLMERFTMVPWLTSGALDAEYCEACFSLSLMKSVFGAFSRNELAGVASAVKQRTWPRLVQSMVVARFNCAGQVPPPDYDALFDLLLDWFLTINGGVHATDDAKQVFEILNDWAARRQDLISETPWMDKEAFFSWLASENLPLHK